MKYQRTYYVRGISLCLIIQKSVLGLSIKRIELSFDCPMLTLNLGGPSKGLSKVTLSPKLTERLSSTIHAGPKLTERLSSTIHAGSPPRHNKSTIRIYCFFIFKKAEKISWIWIQINGYAWPNLHLGLALNTLSWSILFLINSWPNMMCNVSLSSLSHQLLLLLL